ncbi:MAG: 2-oxo acid dehydrogenase subunit E2 [Chloroflexi bacterium]|nr:2-oxo acid dehydrogenase subunit E2 [Chloroflexota bacterium]
MAVEVVMPRLSDTMEEGKVLKWLKGEGDEVKRGEPIAEIETDKAAMELESFENGILSKIIVPPDQTVPVGEPIALITTSGERREAPPAPAPEAEKAAAAPPTPPSTAAAPAPRQPVEERIKASPLARRIAEERGIDLGKVPGTGPDGRITKEDVLAFIKQMEEIREVRPKPEAPPAPIGAEMVDLTRMQATIAERMTRTKQTVPHFYVTTSIEMSEATRMLNGLRAVGEAKTAVSYNHLVIKATALALIKFPIVNAFFHDGKMQYNKGINISIAVAVPQGLLVPVLHDCDKKNLSQIAAEARQLIDRVRAGHMTTSDFEGATFTVSNLGMFDVEDFAAIINPPESGILAVGSVRPTPVARAGQVVIGETMKVTLSADHRVYYGVTAAQFLQEIKRLLENPLSLVM